MNNGQSGLLAGGIIIYAIVMLVIVAFGIFIWWKIFSKAGYSGALAFLMLVPIANLVMILVLAFGEWPVLRELQMLRQQQGMRPPFPQGPQMPYPQYPNYQGPQGQYPSQPQYPDYRG